MTPVQSILYELLTEMDEICVKHNIKYYLGGGTALGAVRNKGFLPWDNDMDIYMARSEYNKLCKVIDDELKTDRFFVSNERNLYYLNPIARYGNSNTTKLYFSLITDGEACGQHFDILIFDPFPNDVEEQKVYKEKLQIYCEILQPYFTVHRNSFRNTNKFNYALYKSYLEKIDQQGKDTVIQEFEDYFLSFPDEESELYCMRWGLEILCYNRAYFGEPRRVLFEDKMFPIAEKAEKIFRLAYGDNWMLIPPRNLRVEKNALDNCDVPCKKLVSLYHKGYDKDQAVNDFFKYKNSVLYFRLVRESFDKKRHQKAFDQAVKKLQNTTNVEKYLQVQLHPVALKYELCANVPIKLVENALYILLKEGNFKVIFKILNLRKLNNFLISEEILKIEQTASQMRELSIAYYDLKDFSAIVSFYHKFEDTDIPFFSAMRNIALLEQIADKEVTEEASLLEMLSKKLGDHYHYQDDLFVKTTADVYMELDEINKACELYSVLLSRTLNAFIIRDIEEMQKEYPQIQKHLGFTKEQIQLEYDRIKGTTNSKKAKKDREKLNKMKYRTHYALYLLCQPLNSDFSVFRSISMYREYRSSKKVVAKYRKKFNLIKKVAKNLG